MLDNKFYTAVEVQGIKDKAFAFGLLAGAMGMFFLLLGIGIYFEL